MSVRNSQPIVATFTTRSPTTGARTNADSTPTGTIVLDGVDNAAAVTITNTATGRYKAAATLPSLVGIAMVELVIVATVGGIADSSVVWRDTTEQGNAILNQSFEGSIASVLGNGRYGLSFENFAATVFDDAFPVTLTAIDGAATGGESPGTITGGAVTISPDMTLQVGDTIRIGPSKAMVRSVSITTEIN